jgi:serine/threonine-protein kinase RsbW
VTSYPLRDKADLARVREMVREAAQDVGGEAEAILDCLVSVTEACTNALVHGRRSDDVLDPVLTWEINRRVARFVVQDYGAQPESGGGWARARPWAKTEVSDPSPRSGGFGLGLMRSLMDEVDITSDPNGTTVVLVKHWD